MAVVENYSNSPGALLQFRSFLDGHGINKAVIGGRRRRNSLPGTVVGALDLSGFSHQPY
jgi:hypothetical protein